MDWAYQASVPPCKELDQQRRKLKHSLWRWEHYPMAKLYVEHPRNRHPIPQSSSLSSSSSSSSSSRPSTSEQNDIIQYPIIPGSELRIIGFAGTGKTETIIEYCMQKITQHGNSKPALRILFVVFNKAAQLQAGQRFVARNLHTIEVSTLHSRALASFRRFRARLEIGNHEIPAEVIIQKLGLGFDPDTSPNSYAHWCRAKGLSFAHVIPRHYLAGFAKNVNRVLEAFFHSSQTEIPRRWLPGRVHDWHKRISERNAQIPRDPYPFYSQCASYLWDLMQGTRTHTHAHTRTPTHMHTGDQLRMTHDGYTKWWALDIINRRTRDEASYDLIIVDEV